MGLDLGGRKAYVYEGKKELLGREPSLIAPDLKWKASSYALWEGIAAAFEHRTEHNDDVFSHCSVEGFVLYRASYDRTSCRDLSHISLLTCRQTVIASVRPAACGQLHSTASSGT
jgi:hypothetical protein